MVKKKSPVSKKKVVKHLKGDIKTFKKEAAEDRELIHELKESKKHEKKEEKKEHKGKKKDPKPKPRTKMAKKVKVEKVMHEFKSGELHSGSKKGPKVTNPKQAIAIAMSEAGLSKKKKRKK